MVTRLAVSEHLIASGSEDGDVRLWDVNSGTLARQFPKFANQIGGLAFDSSGTFLTIGTVINSKAVEDPATYRVDTGDLVAKFAIKQGDTIQVFDTFPSFSTALAALVNGTNVVSGLYAEGNYDSVTGDFAAHLLVVRIGASLM